MPKTSRELTPAEAEKRVAAVPPAMRLEAIARDIQARAALAPETVETRQHVYRPDALPPTVVNGQGPDSRVACAVTGAPYLPQVLRPAMLTVPAGCVAPAAHAAEELVAFVIAGTGRLILNDSELALEEGMAAYVPRWCRHQFQNTGDDELALLTVSDRGLVDALTSASEQTGIEARVPRVEEPLGAELAG